MQKGLGRFPRGASGDRLDNESGAISGPGPASSGVDLLNIACACRHLCNQHVHRSACTVAATRSYREQGHFEAVGLYVTLLPSQSYSHFGECRSRHVKCDEQRPTCSTCAENGWSCSGYSKEIFFENDLKESDGRARYRQMLFTNHEREALNGHMLNNVPFDATSAVLSDIDENCARLDDTDGLEIFRGPFGVFRFSHAHPVSLDDGYITSSYSLLYFQEETFDLFDWNVAVETDALIGTDMPGKGSIPLDAVLQVQHDSGQNVLWQDTFANAPLLLKHYADVLIPMLTPIRHQKTPWHVLFLPCTKQTLATITIGQQAHAADLTTFFGTLALSSLSLEASTGNSEWKRLAQSFQLQAQTCLQDTLKHALDVPKQYKYKSVVMAILTMVQISMAAGSWDETDALLLEIEKMIRLRGLSKLSKSRKVRMLHHCYAHTRILQESISMTSSRSPTLLTIMDAIEGSDILVKGADLPLFGLGTWDNLEQKYQQDKSQEEGENDLHLASPGQWKATLYPEIFGVSETWLNLLSQTIRLANEKALAESIEVSMLSLREFSARAKALERYILQCANKSGRGQSADLIDRQVLSQVMQRALYNALVIYFYRRVYGIDADLLQAKVIVVQEQLTLCKQLCDSAGVFDALMWPAFVAGCEAIEPDLQHFYSSWFESDSIHNKLAAHKTMKQLMHRVWEHRRDESTNSCSWVRFLCF